MCVVECRFPLGTNISPSTSSFAFPLLQRFVAHRSASIFSPARQVLARGGPPGTRPDLGVSVPFGFGEKMILVPHHLSRRGHPTHIFCFRLLIWWLGIRGLYGGSGEACLECVSSCAGLGLSISSSIHHADRQCGPRRARAARIFIFSLPATGPGPRRPPRYPLRPGHFRSVRSRFGVKMISSPCLTVLRSIFRDWGEEDGREHQK